MSNRKLFVEFEEPERDDRIERVGHDLIGYLVLNAKCEDPRTAKQICAALDIKSDSSIQAIVHQLRGHIGAQVGSRCVNPAGYWMARNYEEIQETEHNLKSRALACLFALSGLKKGRGEDNQLRLL